MPKELDNSSAGTFNDVFALVLSSQTDLIISMKGNGCDPHLTLTDARGKKIEGDAAKAGRLSNIRRKLAPGKYFVWAGTMPFYWNDIRSNVNKVCSYILSASTKL